MLVSVCFICMFLAFNSLFCYYDEDFDFEYIKKNLTNYHYSIKNLKELKSISNEFFINYLEFYNLSFITNYGYTYNWILTNNQKIFFLSVENKMSKGTLILFHGYRNHTPEFARFIERAIKEGYSIVSFDLPNHGLSDGKLYTLTNFNEYRQFFDIVLDFISKNKKRPYIGIGFSTGATILFDGILRNEERFFDKLIFISPLIRWQKYFISVNLSYLVKDIILSIPTPNGSEFSSNKGYKIFKKNYEYFKEDHIPLNWVYSMEKWIKEIENLTNSNMIVECPLLIIQGTKDRVVEYNYNIKFIAKFFKSVNIKYIKNSDHNILNEYYLYRIEAFDRIFEFLNKNNN